MKCVDINYYKMKHKLLLSTVLVGSVLLATAAKDPVLMKINGKDVKLSEFEYLYNKNSKQQVEKESLDQYVDRFITYKLKVADAEADQLDTLPSFQKNLTVIVKRWYVLSSKTLP